MVLIAVRVHPFPSRTRQLSSPAPKILGWRRPGKIGNANTRVKRQTYVCRFFFSFPVKQCKIPHAVPTAEGAIQIAMEELPITIHGARVLVIGYGRVGRMTAQRFQALGAKVSVSARKYADLAWAESLGLGVEQTGRLLGWLCGYDLVINTVPARVLGEAELGDLKPGCLVIDLASKPGGAGECVG